MLPGGVDQRETAIHHQTHYPKGFTEWAGWESNPQPSG